MFDRITPQLIQLTTDMGQMIMSYYAQNIEAGTKADNTPITVADHKAHQMVVEGLSKLTPNIPVLTEESDEISFAERQGWDEYWLVDPLDGTRDFLDQTGEFCICIAYIKNHRSVFGMVYVPVNQTHYYTSDEGLAYKLQNKQTTQLSVQANHDPLEVVIGHHSAQNEQLQSHLHEVGEHRLSKLGSAIKFCQIAEGLYDYYPRFGPCSEWDTAAGACILRCAGGLVVDQAGQELTYNTQESLLSPVFFALNKAQ